METCFDDNRRTLPKVLCSLRNSWRTLFFKQWESTIEQARLVYIIASGERGLSTSRLHLKHLWGSQRKSRNGPCGKRFCCEANVFSLSSCPLDVWTLALTAKPSTREVIWPVTPSKNWWNEPDSPSRVSPFPFLASSSVLQQVIFHMWKVELLGVCLGFHVFTFHPSHQLYLEKINPRAWMSQNSMLQCSLEHLSVSESTEITSPK